MCPILVFRWLVVGFGGKLILKWFNIEILWEGKLNSLSELRMHAA